MQPLSTLDRRSLLKALAASPLAVALPVGVQAEVAAAGLISSDVCMLQKEVTEGPFYLDPRLVRSDITEGKAGLPMQLRLQLVNADCSPVVGARIDVWHCDASGAYSGVRNLGDDAETVGQTYLRGTQSTDLDGIVVFQTIFPGWYHGRTTHIHFKVFLGDKTLLTSQIFFDEAVNDAIYQDNRAYARAEHRDLLNAGDGIALEAGEGAHATVKMTEPDGYMEAALVVGISPDGAATGLLDWLWRKV